jgi:phytoene/squalene synthetase
MLFDAQRRGRLITQAELSAYTQALATAVTEALYYFIGHKKSTPHMEGRYLAVSAAHLAHMLRDAIEDCQAGYFNIPIEYLQKHGISACDVESPAYRQWVRERVALARRYFKAGGACTARVSSLRCRLAGYAYTARFEWMLQAIERDDYRLRSDYPERKSLKAALWIGWRALKGALASPWSKPNTEQTTGQAIRVKGL